MRSPKTAEAPPRWPIASKAASVRHSRRERRRECKSAERWEAEFFSVAISSTWRSSASIFAVGTRRVALGSA